jgi:putative membrane protein
LTGIWITDGNALSLFGVMNSREIGAANRELERYRSDTVRVFAEAMLHEHAAMQRGVDSVAAVTRIAPIASALAVPIGVMMQAQTDLVQGVRGAALDRAFVRQQIAAHELMAAYIDQLGAVAQRPEVQGFMKSALSRVRSHLQRAQALDSLLAVADSVATADSAAKASLRAKRQSPDR